MSASLDADWAYFLFFQEIIAQINALHFFSEIVLTQDKETPLANHTARYGNTLVIEYPAICIPT